MKTAKEFVEQFHTAIEYQPLTQKIDDEVHRQLWSECAMSTIHMTYLVKRIEECGRHLCEEIPNAKFWDTECDYIKTPTGNLIHLEQYHVQYRLDLHYYPGGSQDIYIADMLLHQIHNSIESFAANHDETYVTPLHVRQYDDNVVRVGWRIGGTID